MGREDYNMQTRLAIVENRVDETIEMLKETIVSLRDRVATLEKLVFIGFGIVVTLQVAVPIMIKALTKQ